MSGNVLQECGAARIALWGGVVLAAVLGIRYGLLEAGVLPRDCSAESASLWLCGFKTALVQSFLHQRLGWFALACGALAFALSCRRLAWWGWLAGIAGLVLYSYDYAAVGALLALLVLGRPRDGAQHGQGKAEAGQQPADGLRVGRLR